MPHHRALVLSPFATVPDDAGQRRRVRQTTRLLKEMGYSTTFFLYAFEEGWMNAANEAHLEDMRREWGEVIVLGANSKVGAPAASGAYHWLDEWWCESLEHALKEIFRFRYFELFVVHNIWLSKAFEFAPRSTIRVLDTHDVFSVRGPYFEKLGIKPEFYLPYEKSERDGASRSDIVLGIQEKDASWFAERTETESICLPYYRPVSSPRVAPIDYLHSDKVVFGFLGSAHIFNIHGLLAFCAELKDLVGRTAAPVELRVAGNVGECIETRGPWIIEGYVKDEAAFLSSVDFIVVPVFNGSGFKVKVADSIAFGKPVISSVHAAIGLKLDESLVAETPSELARLAAHIALTRPKLADFQAKSLAAHAELGVRYAAGSRRLSRRIRAKSTDHTFIYDLSSLSPRETQCVLLSWLGAFQVLRNSARQLVVVPTEVERELAGMALPGVTFLPETSFDRSISRARRWMTVANRLPEELGVDQQSVCVDETWARALGHTSSGLRDGEPGIFWHSINWDLASRRIVNQAVRRAPTAERLRETVLILDRQRSPRLAEQLVELYGDDFSVLDVGNFADFYNALMHVASDVGSIRRVVVFTSLNVQRLMILRELCGARGVEYFGPLGKGGLSFGRASKELVQAHFLNFERRWRELLDRFNSRREATAAL